MSPTGDPGETPYQLASMLRSMRARVMWTQEDLAERSGMSVGTIAGIESGRVRRPRSGTLRILADALGLSEQQRVALVEAAHSGDSFPATEPSLPPLRLVVPGQLPCAVAGFAGRVEFLRSLDDLATTAEQSTTVVISAVSGTAGVGKTALAVHWANRARNRFPDGQLYVNLRGFDPSGSALEPAEAMHGLLDALGGASQRIPADLDAQAALYRSLLSEKRVLVVLDNARDTDQIRPLLPGSPGSLVVVTSRNDLSSLIAKEGAHPLRLGLLTSAEARDLLAHRLGNDRVAAEPDATDDIIERCARLPLALAIVAARAAAHPRFPLQTLADELHDNRLDVLAGSDQEVDVRTVFSWSYHQLSSQARQLFRLLGLHPGPDISAPAAASLAALASADVRPLLTEVARSHLITEHLPGRYSFHDLLRPYATELAKDTDTEAARHEATLRMLDHYLHSASAGARLLYPQRDPIVLAAATEGVTVERVADHEHALTWFTTERPVLLATIHAAAKSGFDTHAWQLSWSISTFLMRHGHWRDQATSCQAALTSAQRLGDRPAQVGAHLGLAHVHTQLGRLSDARWHLQQAHELSGQLGDRRRQADTYRDFAWLSAREGDYTKALDYALRAHDLYRRSDHRAGLAYIQSLIGWYHSRLGDHEEALAWCGQALALFQQLGYRDGEAATWDSLGWAHHHLGCHQEAINCYRRALDLARRIGLRYTEAETLTHLGNTQHAAGDTTSARDSWERALAILDDLDHPDADALRARLKELDEPMADIRT